MLPLSERKRELLRQAAIEGARNYNRYLVGKLFLIICEDGSEHIVRFDKSDFKHLTGISTRLSDNAFFNACLSGTLTTSIINEQQKHDWCTLNSKRKRIREIHRLIFECVANALFLTNLHTPTKDYPIAIKNTNIDACIGFVEHNRARSLRKYNSSNNCDSQKKILAIFSKGQLDVQYEGLVYMASVKDLYEQKPNIDSYLSNELIDRLHYII